ncbi:hypothetical protein CGZ69_18910 [Streptomyces peucetius subsp. caesius ATCC 27952]|nr:hypothetical protein CGZ69_18910 [Streptomyces peucetius subsp. caesius ATCC 27952]
MLDTFLVPARARQRPLQEQGSGSRRAQAVTPGLRSRISTDLGTCGSNEVPGRVIFRRYAHEDRASW